MRLFSSNGKVSDDLAIKEQSVLTKALLGKYGVVSVTILGEEGQRSIRIGITDSSKTSEIDKIISKLQDEGKVGAVPIGIRYEGKIVALKNSAT
jgi:hypothetical protein